jgi:rRNA maturation RNase YbeY
MDASKTDIEFHFHQVFFTLKNRKKLKSFIKCLFKQEKRNLDSLSYVFCTDEYLLDINRRYLDHDYYTDIITFELSEPGDFIKGEVYISVERVKENAKLNNTSSTHELHRVIFHGALHLTGQNDKTSEQSESMRQKEERCLSQYFG